MRLAAGDDFPPHQLTSITGDAIAVPDQQQLVHLQLRRFAGCPVCNLHLRSMVVRSDEIARAGVEEVVVFHSDPDELRRYSDKQLYREFGVESGPLAVLKPGAWPGIIGGLGRSLSAIVRRREPPPPLKPHGGSLGFPADFLIASDGRVLASKYGEHAYDQWSVDELLTLAGKAKA
jgi:hypothetical protein